MLVIALLLAVQTAANPAPAAPAAPAAPVAAARLTLDTPVQDIVADAKGKAVLDANLPQMTQHPEYENFKMMSLRQLQPLAPDQLPEALLTKIGTELAALN